MSRLLLGSTAAVLACAAAAAAAADPLAAGFAAPPASARPQTWWHWMNGNVTKAGITADLEAMRRIGLGGATIVNVDCDIPAGPVKFMSPAWREDFKFAVAEAHRLGLTLCVENCAGWSSSGGPWNTPANGMQCLTASEARVSGPTPFDAVLAKPPVTLGVYHDVAVLAFRASPAAAATGPAAGKLVVTRAVFAAEGGGSADVTALIADRVKAGKLSIKPSPASLGGDPASGSVKALRVDFTLNGVPATLTADEGDTLTLPVTEAQLAAARLPTARSVRRTFVRPPAATGPADAAAVRRDDVIDLTDRMGADGRLRWDAPAGDWVLLRVGYTPVGIDNHPAPAEGRGLECDKMSAAALDAHWAGFMQPVLDDLGPLAPGTLTSSLIDSYEVGGQDWTGDFREQFRRLRGYDPVPFLPAFTRHIVDSPAVTERFLWDVRRTVADLFAERYFQHFADLCHARGLSAAIEPYTGPFESLQCGRPADVVMGEFWTGSQGHPSVKMAASIAHIFGKPVVAAESFTAWARDGGWKNDPAGLKPLGDLMFCQGLNRMVFHRYAMQPWTDRTPGMTMGPFGFEFERTVTWWDQGKGWIDYLSRCQFLLQQGRAVSDVAYFTGEGAPVEMRVGQPACPAGYDYDAVNADVLLHGARVDHGRLTLASGASYAVLVLPPGGTNMTPAVLEAVRELVLAGATVVGPKPTGSPSLTDYPACDAAVAKVADELWGDGAAGERAVGRGKVASDRSLAELFAGQKLAPDFEAKGVAGDVRLASAHRAVEGGDLYFVSNQQRQAAEADCVFRVAGRLPELWHPDTGVTEPAPVWSEHDGRTTVRVRLDPAGSAFVVFRRPAGGGDHVVDVRATMATRPGGGLRVDRATFAATDGSGSADVTPQVAGMVRDGRLVVAVTHDTFAPDPALMHAKELRVDYTVNGRPGRAVVAEEQTLTLPPMADGPAAEPSVAADGTPAVKLWADGSADLRTAAGSTLHAAAAGVPASQELAGRWTVRFPPGRGAPASVTLDKLISWPDHPDAGVRYFSGTATYEAVFDVAADRLAGGRELWLDLGEVRNFADVSVNGRPLGVLWKPPFRVDLTGVARAGRNALTVRVTNLWPNRLIGDEQLPADCEWVGERLRAWPQWLLDGRPSPTGRLTFATWRHYRKDSPLLPSGLLGPVTLRTAVVVPAK